MQRSTPFSVERAREEGMWTPARSFRLSMEEASPQRAQTLKFRYSQGPVGTNEGLDFRRTISLVTP